MSMSFTIGRIAPSLRGAVLQHAHLNTVRTAVTAATPAVANAPVTASWLGFRERLSPDQLPTNEERYIVQSPGDLERDLRLKRDVSILAKEDFNQFYLRNSNLFPLSRSKSTEEHRALRLAARKKFDLSIDILAELGPESVDSVHRVLTAFRKASKAPTQLTPESLAKLDDYFKQIKTPNAALFGFMVETYMQVNNPSKALEYCKAGSQVLKGDEATTLYNIVLFETADRGSDCAASRVLQSMADAKITPDHSTFEYFIRACVRESNGVDLATRALREMKSIGIAVRESIYVALAKLLPTISAANEQHKLAYGLLDAITSTTPSDREATAILLSLLSGHAKAVKDEQLLYDIYHVACKTNPSLAGDSTSILDTYFWENVLSLQSDDQYAVEVLNWVVIMPLEVKLHITTIQNLSSLAKQMNNHTAAVRLLKDLYRIYGVYASRPLFNKATFSLLNSLRRSDELSNPKLRLAAVSSVEQLLLLFEELRITHNADVLVVCLLLLGFDKDALRIMRSLDLASLERTFQTAVSNGLEKKMAQLKPLFPDVEELRERRTSFTENATSNTN